MSDLLRLLDIGSGALQAQNAGVAVATNNAANVNTEGYSRQMVDLASLQRAPLVGGVRFGDAERAKLELLALRLRDNAASVGLAESKTRVLADLEAALTSAGADLTRATAELFGLFAELGASPMDGHVRDEVVAAGRRLSAVFRQHAAAIDQARSQADDRIGDWAGEATALASEIAAANRALTIDPDPVVQDKRDQAALRLAELVGGRGRIDPDGHLRFVLPNGEVVVDGTRAAAIQVAPDPAWGGRLRVDIVDGSHRRDVTGALSGGKIAGDLEFRDISAGQKLAELDQLAFDLATQVNAVHRVHAGLGGATGNNFFAEPAVASGAAAAFALDPVIDGDSRLVASKAPGSGDGDNQGALALLALRDGLLARGGTQTFVGEGIRMLADLGRLARAAETEYELGLAQRDSLAALRDSMAGVSLQEELVRLSQFRHAAEASTRFIATIDQLLGTILEVV